MRVSKVSLNPLNLSDRRHIEAQLVGASESSERASLVKGAVKIAKCLVSGRVLAEGAHAHSVEIDISRLLTVDFPLNARLDALLYKDWCDVALDPWMQLLEALHAAEELVEDGDLGRAEARTAWQLLHAGIRRRLVAEWRFLQLHLWRRCSFFQEVSNGMSVCVSLQCLWGNILTRLP